MSSEQTLESYREADPESQRALAAHGKLAKAAILSTTNTGIDATQIDSAAAISRGSSSSASRTP